MNNQKKKLTGYAAIECAEATGATLHKHVDPIEGARNVTADEAREIAASDPSLIWCIEANVKDFEAHQYTLDGGWDFDSIVATAREGVADEDIHRLIDYYGEEQAEEAARQLTAYCEAIVEETKE